VQRVLEGGQFGHPGLDEHLRRHHLGVDLGHGDNERHRHRTGACEERRGDPHRRHDHPAGHLRHSDVSDYYDVYDGSDYYDVYDFSDVYDVNDFSDYYDVYDFGGWHPDHDWPRQRHTRWCTPDGSRWSISFGSQRPVLGCRSPGPGGSWRVNGLGDPSPSGAGFGDRERPQGNERGWMTPEASAPADRRRQLKRLWILASALLVFGGTSLGVGLESEHHPLAGPVGQTDSASAPTHDSASLPTTNHAERVPPAVTLPAVARSEPVLLRVPAIGVSVSLSTLGLNPTGTVQVPTNYQQPGWYELGPSPGEEGSAVILGHVDTYEGPAIFFRLRTLKAGDHVIVTLADGIVTTFKVDTVAMYLKTRFPAQQVYGTHGNIALQLVTCGGTFDTQTGHYLSNVVVYTTLVTTTSV